MQEEERLKREKSESTNLVSTSKEKGNKRKKDEVAKGPDKKKNLRKVKIVSFIRNLDT